MELSTSNSLVQVTVYNLYNKKQLTHYQTTNFRLFQTERVCRRQFQIWRKWQKVIQMGRKHCGKRRNCSLRVFRPGNPSQGIPLPIGIVSCLFRQKCCFVCPLYIAESAKTTSFPSIYRDCLSHSVNAFLSSKLSSSKRHGIARVLQSFNN